MAINKNHEFEELDGIKCAVVERLASPDRVAFIKPLLEHNGYTVIVIASPPPKTAPVPPPVATAEPADAPIIPAAPPTPSSFTVGVTDVCFNAVNAVFGRLLKTKEGKTVTLAYWQQKEAVPRDDIPYFEKPV